MELLTSHDLALRGYRPNDLTRLVADGEITRLHQGHYLLGGTTDREGLHLLEASLWDDVWALETAALAHGLPLLGAPPPQVHLVVPGSGRSRGQAGRRVHSAPLVDADVTTVRGHRVTSVARTVVDITRTRGLLAGLVPWEAARWQARVRGMLKTFDEQTALAVERLARRRGIAQARLALTIASAWSQSPMETQRLHLIRTMGLPEPHQQYAVLDHNGEVIGYTDFAWPEWGVLGEYDGMDKYERLARPGETPAQAVRHEKRRQRRMEKIGWEFARWEREEMRRPRAIHAEIMDARLRAARRALLPNLLPFAG